MDKSNYTLKFHRTSTDAFGHQVEFENQMDQWDSLVGYFAVFAAGFIFGLLIGAY